MILYSHRVTTQDLAGGHLQTRGFTSPVAPAPYPPSPAADPCALAPVLCAPSLVVRFQVPACLAPASALVVLSPDLLTLVSPVPVVRSLAPAVAVPNPAVLAPSVPNPPAPARDFRRSRCSVLGRSGSSCCESGCGRSGRSGCWGLGLCSMTRSTDRTAVSGGPVSSAAGRVLEAMSASGLTSFVFVAAATLSRTKFL